MSIAPVEINLELVNRKVKFACVSNGNPEIPIMIDYLPPLGDGEGFLGLELLAMSFAGCVSTGIVALLRKTGKELKSYSMKLTGVKKEKPLSLERIIFEITIEAGDLTEEEVENALKQAENISPVWIAIKNNVEVSWKYKII